MKYVTLALSTLSAMTAMIVSTSIVDIEPIIKVIILTALILTTTVTAFLAGSLFEED
tara:strand:+ start:6681 stop:6851 length:171 start_codon:yes stop_codon:yes gene_type:complete